MGIVFRQSVKTSIINFSGAFLGAVIVYLSTKFFSTTAYGYIRNMLYISVLAQCFVTLGTSNTLITFTQRYQDGSDKKRLLFTIALLTPLIITILSCIPYFIFRHYIIDIYKVTDQPYVSAFYFYIPVLVVFNGMIIPLEQYLFAHSKAAVPALFREVIIRLLNILLIVLFACKFLSYHSFIIGMVLSYLIPVIGLLFFVIRSGFWGISFRWSAFSIKEYKEIIHFSWYHLLFGLSVNMMGAVDSIMLAPYSGMSALAVYTTAIYIVTLLNIPYRAMSNSSFAVLNKTFLENDIKKLNDFFHRSAINIFIASLYLALVIACNLPNIAHLLPKAYIELIPITLILIISKLVDMATGFNNELLSISKHYKISFRISVTLIILLVGFYIVLIPRYGIYGAAWGSTLAITFFNLLKMYFLWRKLRIQPFSGNTLLVLVAGIFAALASYLMPQFSNLFMDGILRFTLITFIYVLMLLWLKPSVDLTIT